MIIIRPVVIGMGRVGSLIAFLLGELGMQVVGVDMQEVSEVPDNVDFRRADITNPEVLARLCHGKDAVITCLPYHLILGVAQVAQKVGIHYFDLTEDISTAQAVRALAETAPAVMIPQNGLAPGFIGMLGAYLAQQFDAGSLRFICLRVGALPQHPTGQLGYAANWSPEGLVNAYLRPCEVIVHGQRQKMPALSNPEILRIDGVEYEAFLTSGGLGTMAETYAGHVEALDYKSMRYPGHHAGMQLLITDLRFQDTPEELVRRIRYALPPDAHDKVVIHATVQGNIHGALQTKGLVIEYKPILLGGQRRTAIAWTTAAALVAVVELVRNNTLPQHGFVKQEAIPLTAFLQTTTGKLFTTYHPALGEVCGL
jgi:saccharopine dehydrogenase-like NADP-dependent oxidoreductase